jgi:RHS repeat-associated protein
MTVAGQSAVNYTYDNDNRLTQITQGTSTASFAYDIASRRTSMTLPNGVATTYSYDTASELTGLTYKLGSTTLGALTYGYDARGQRTAVGGSYARTGLPLAVSSATYDAANELNRWGTANLTYDSNGNLTNDGLNTYTWDARNHLASISASGSTIGTFGYDAVGRRMTKTVGGTATSFLYDGVSPVQELSGATPTANLLTGLGVDEVLSRTDSAGARSFLAGALGSTVALTDSAGAVQTQYTYDPFGNTSFSGPASNDSFQYAARENDGTGLYYYRARYYNLVLQRFISEDPIGLNGGDVNLYGYTGNSPTNFTDPSGKSNPVIHVVEGYWGARDAGMGVLGSLNLAFNSTLVDIGTQGLGAGMTNIHAMAGELPDGTYQTSQQAYQGTQATMSEALSENSQYTDPFNAHTIADSYSDSHNYGPDTSTMTWLDPWHALPDLVYHRAARNSIANYLRDRMNGRQCDPGRYLKPAPPESPGLPLPPFPTGGLYPGAPFPL